MRLASNCSSAISTRAECKNFLLKKTLLYVHGATYPSETAFDLPIQGVSMMDLIASRGYDVYLVDIRGYGGSTRPPEMSQPASANKPIVSTKVAAQDFGTAVDYILKKRGLSKINVMGWSWGTSTVGLYTSEYNDKVNRLVLYAPQWIRTEAPAPAATNAPALRLKGWPGLMLGAERGQSAEPVHMNATRAGCHALRSRNTDM